VLVHSDNFILCTFHFSRLRPASHHPILVDLEHFSIRRDLFRVIRIRPSFRHACNSIWQELCRWQKQYFRADEHRNQHSQVRISGALSMSINAMVQIRQEVELNCHDLPVRMEGGHRTRGTARGVLLKGWARNTWCDGREFEMVKSSERNFKYRGTILKLGLGRRHSSSVGQIRCASFLIP
jgi:hypothetical protein